MPVSQELTKGTIVPIVLKLLSERAMYGYEIIREVNERTENALEWREGTLYPWLHRLAGEGLVTSEWVVADSGRRRKYYLLTPAGAGALESKASEWAVFAAAVNALLLEPGLVT
ncbi:MAG: PadR family transcriptional regulator PadR [Rhodothermales bacterium]|jgi:PadR family transcriptional regulator PadR